MSYYATVKKIGKPAASLWLAKRLQHLEARIYGKGFEERCRALMRYVEDKEMGGM